MISAIGLTKIRFQERKNLNEENLSLYKAITSYIKICSNLTWNEKEEILQQIMDMILQAQLENKSIDLFIGKDYEEFCNSIIKEYYSSKSKIYRILNYIQSFLFWSATIITATILSNILLIGTYSGVGLDLNQLVLSLCMAFLLVPKKINVKLGLTLKGSGIINGILLVFLMYPIISFGIKFLLGFSINQYIPSNYFIDVENKNMLYIIISFVLMGAIEVFKLREDHNFG